MQKLGFVGLGIMGKPMALNLLKAGYPLTVYDIDAQAVADVVRAGAAEAASAKAVAEASEIVITMLPNSPHVQEVVLGADGLLEGLSSGDTVIDMSSIAPLVTQDLAEALAEKGAAMLDAPVSGGQEKAELGTLAIMVGGKEETFAACKEILEVMGASATLVGDHGAGQTTKLVNQMIVAVNIAAVAEAMSLGKRAGVDPEQIFQAIRKGLAGSQCLEDKGQRMFQGNYDPGFRIELHVKDLANVFATSRELNLALPLTSQVMEMMQVLLADGHGQKDHGGLGLFYEKLNSLSLKEGS